MPVLTINTNVPANDVPSDFKKQATEVIANSLGKPKSYIAIHVNANQDISFGGTDKPAALCDLVSIGALSKDMNKRHAKAIMELLDSQLKVPKSRTYITFNNTDKADIGFNGTTFDDLLLSHNRKFLYQFRSWLRVAIVMQLYDFIILATLLA